MKKNLLAVVAMFVGILFLAIQAHQSSAAIRRAEKKLTLQNVIQRLENGGEFKVTQKKGRISKLEKAGENWKVDYVILNVNVVDTIPGMSAISVDKAYLVKVDSNGNVQFILGTQGMLTAGEGSLNDTRVIGARLMVSAPGPEKIKVTPDEDVFLLFVNKASATERLEKKAKDKIQEFREKGKRKPAIKELPPKVEL